MKDHKVNLAKTEGFYRLTPPKNSLSRKIGQFIFDLIKLPFHLYQAVVGRLISYLVINPLFRKDENNESQVIQHPKHPDPLFASQDEMYIINVVLKKNILMRVLLNWHNFLINHTTTLRVAFSLLKQIVRLFPVIQTAIDEHLDSVVDCVEAHVKTTKSRFKPNQIHFRGLEKLDNEQKEALYNKLYNRIGYDFRPNREHVYFYSLQTVDNAVLDSVEIRGELVAKQDISERRFIISCMPRSNNYVDWMKQYQFFVKELDVTVVAFNYRGVGLSKGIVYSETSLRDDTYAQVQRLLLLGARPENITLMGECVGGNVATHTAGKLHEEGHSVKLYNARSFRSFISILEGRSIPDANAPLWHPRTLLQWLNYGFVKLILTPLVISSGWSLNVERSFKKIPPADRDFLVVRSKKDEQGNRFRDDAMIPYGTASIYSLVKEQFDAIEEKKQAGQAISDEEAQWLNDIPKTHKFHVSEQLHAHAKTADGHIVPPQLLVPTHKVREDMEADGRQYALGFFKRVWPSRQTPALSEQEYSKSSPK